MIGSTFKSETRTYRDEKTGVAVRRLTSGGNNFHMYFTENSFLQSSREIIFFSDRGAPAAGHYNLFHMNLETGAITQLTDEAEPLSNKATKSKCGHYAYYVVGNTIKKLDTQTLEAEVIFESGPGLEIGMLSLSADGRRLGFARNETVDIDRGPNYGGFLDNMFAVKKSVLTVLDIEDKTACDVFSDTHWLGHFQFAPDDAAVGMFCHEGPWNLVQQRIWIFDFIAREARPCFRQGKDDCVGHEFWTRDGRIFFDNRGKGHDGTITSGKTQAYAQPDETQTPYVGLADRKGRILRTVEMPFYCNHYHSGKDADILVGDAAEDLCLISIAGERARMRTLCYHGTSWYTQNSHCHPTFDWDGRQVLFESDRGGRLNLYLVDTDEIKREMMP